MPRAQIEVRRIYDEAPPHRGSRVLVDRLWPRGVSKASAQLDEWSRTVAPSAELRKWYGHQPDRFDEFRRRYVRELGGEGPAEAVRHLLQLAEEGGLTLITATRDVDRSGAAVLAEYLRSGGRPAHGKG